MELEKHEHLRESNSKSKGIPDISPKGGVPLGFVMSTTLNVFKFLRSDPEGVLCKLLRRNVTLAH